MDPVNTYIDIFTKLIIAFISLVAPFTSYLLTTHSSQTADLIKANDEMRHTIVQQSLNEIVLHSKEGIGELDKKELEKFSSETLPRGKELAEKLNTIKLQEKRDLEFLRPKGNISVIFSCLSLSLIFIIVDVFVRKDYFKCFLPYSHCFSCGLLVISLSLFLYAIWRIHKTVWAYIDTQKTIDDYKPDSIIKEGTKPLENIPKGDWKPI